jgi:hypothetical protein
MDMVIPFYEDNKELRIRAFRLNRIYGNRAQCVTSFMSNGYRGVTFIVGNPSWMRDDPVVGEPEKMYHSYEYVLKGAEELPEKHMFHFQSFGHLILRFVSNGSGERKGERKYDGVVCTVDEAEEKGLVKHGY